MKLEAEVTELCRKAREASPAMFEASTGDKNRMLEAMAVELESRRGEVGAANGRDVAAAREAGLAAAAVDRLTLTDQRYAAMVGGVREVVALEDPVGTVMREWTLYNGIRMQKVRVPIGVIGMIYESRPNVTVDAAVLCLKAGNVPVLRGGREAFHSNAALVEALRAGASRAGFPAEVVGFLPMTDREAVPVFCRMDRYVDLMIPRGGHGLIKTVVEHARMPVIKHYHGVCHVYVHAAADLDMAERIILNAKCQRPGVCNAMETLLVDREVARVFVPRIVKALQQAGVEVRAEARDAALAGGGLCAPEGWDIEYLELILALKVVDGLDGAVEHLRRYGSHHTDTIVTRDAAAAEQFLRRVDSATVLWNASTRFSDGGQFGFGAEIGISTDKIHARGPMALEELTIYKYVARGDGQVRG